MNYINVRGCNGSGKTTLLRSLAKRYGPPQVGKIHLEDRSLLPFTHFLVKGRMVACLGDYVASGQITAGCDRIRTQKQVKDALQILKEGHVHLAIFEGVVISTIYEPWFDWARKNGGMVWAFLDTPLKVCLERIQARNGGKPIKEDQVASKYRTIGRVREKAKAAGERVVDLPYESAVSGLSRLVEGLVNVDG